MSDTSDFSPLLVTLRTSMKHKIGEAWADAVVIRKEPSGYEICYSKAAENCVVCLEDCPFNKNPNRKEA